MRCKRKSSRVVETKSNCAIGAVRDNGVGPFLHGACGKQESDGKANGQFFNHKQSLLGNHINVHQHKPIRPSCLRDILGLFVKILALDLIRQGGNRTYTFFAASLLKVHFPLYVLPAGFSNMDINITEVYSGSYL